MKNDGKSVLQQAAELERRLAKLDERHSRQAEALYDKQRSAVKALIAEYPKEVQEKAGVSS